MTEQKPRSPREAILQLNQLCDVLALRTYLAKRTDYGRKPGPSEWHHTRAFLAEYAEQTDPQQVIDLFAGQGVPNDIEAGRWLLTHNALIPAWDAEEDGEE
jgi:hypothetical protein